MTHKTERLLLRPWAETDAAALYRYAKDPAVGPITGWPVHTSEENSLDIIRTVLSAAETYAITLHGGDEAIGSIGLMRGKDSNLGLPANEAEIGYWLGVPYWGQGLVPEATRALIRYAFEAQELSTLWCGYFDGNEKSKRVGEKCGFRFCYTQETDWPLIRARKTQHITRLTKAEWLALRADPSCPMGADVD